VGTASRFAAHGYQVEVIALAVRAERSRLDSVDRYYEACARGQAGRWTPPTAHDRAYAKLPETVRAAAASPDVHRLVVTNRTGRDLYVGLPHPDRPAEATAALAAGHRAPLREAEARDWLGLLHLNVRRAADTGRLDAVSRPVFAQLAQDARTVLRMAHPDPTSRAHQDATRQIDAIGPTVRAPSPARLAFPASPPDPRPPRRPPDLPPRPPSAGGPGHGPSR
jgi:hypothetical protein